MLRLLPSDLTTREEVTGIAECMVYFTAEVGGQALAVAVLLAVVYQWLDGQGFDWGRTVLLARWIAAVPLGLFSLLLALASTGYCLNRSQPKPEWDYVSSPYPPGWGLLGAVALLLCPLSHAWCFFWLPIVWDLVTYPVRQYRYAETCLALAKAKAEAGDDEARRDYEQMLAAKEEWLAKRP